MSHAWARMRGLANPTQAVQPGGINPQEETWDPGTDVTLPDDHFARLHNPPMGRVPPQLPSPVTRPIWPEFQKIQYFRDFTVTSATVRSLSLQLSFQAETVRVDNYSSHWIWIRSAGIYIPPFVYGSMLMLDPAVAVAEWIATPPPNHIDTSTILESLVLTIWYEASITPSTGFSVPTT